ncbi:TlpA family protein disulfide reductase [Sphingobacterium siyangense]|uniref:TlpA family protein disulfide reductase n=1 Tax=Sphingobacterium siyangense TaxID=459529 RepID=UPI003DA3AABD
MMNTLKLITFLKAYITYIFQVPVKHYLSTDIVLFTHLLRKKIRQGKTYFKGTSVLLKKRYTSDFQNLTKMEASSDFFLPNFAPASAFHAIGIEFSSGFHRATPIKTRCRPDENPMKRRNSVVIGYLTVDYTFAQETHKLDYSATLGSPLLSPCYTQGQLNDCTSPTQQKQAFQQVGESRLTYGVESERSVLRFFKSICKALVFRANNLLGLLDPVVQRALKCLLFVADYKRAYRMILTCLFLCFVSMFSLSAQTPRKDSGADGLSIKSLEVGSIIENQLWNMPLKTIDHTKVEKTITLQKYRGKKLLILDFWTVWCAPCIRKLKELSASQTLIDTNAVVIPVTINDAHAAGRILQQNNIGFSSIYADSLLRKYFPHVSVPHQIWIKDGRVAYITDGNLTSVANINKLVHNKPVQLLPKNAEISREELRNLSKPDIDSNRIGQVILSSVFAKSLPYSVFAKFDTKYSLTLYNHSVLGLLLYANRKEIPFVGMRNRVIWNVADSTRYWMELPVELINTKKYEKENALRAWKSSNLYCYYLKSNEMLDEQQKTDLLKLDLAKLLELKFNARSYVATSRVEAWCLYIRDAAVFKKCYSKSGATGKIKADKGYFSLVNRPLQSLVSYLADNNYKDKLPVTDATGYAGKVSMDLYADTKNLCAVDAALQRYGLGIKRDTIALPMLVIERRGDHD